MPRNKPSQTRSHLPGASLTSRGILRNPDMSLAAAKTESSAPGRIPVLDIAEYLAGEAGAAAPLARALARPGENTGVFPAAKHGGAQLSGDDHRPVAL